MNQYRLFFLLALFSLFFLSCSSSKKKHKSAIMPGIWQSTPIVIDGSSKDWPSPYPNYDPKSLIAYATSNDYKYLYVTVESGDDLTQLKIVNAGMTVSIDTGGGKTLEFNIRYPLPDVNGEQMNIPKAENGQKIENLVLALEKKIKQHVKDGMDDANQFSLEGFASCNGGFSISQQTTCGLKVIAAIDEYKELVWEAAIPFSMILNKDKITSADAGKPISVCVTIKGMKKAKPEGTDNSSAMNSGSMGSGGMAGRGGASGSRGTGKGVSNDPLEILYQTTKTWKYFGLAYQ